MKVRTKFYEVQLVGAMAGFTGDYAGWQFVDGVTRVPAEMPDNGAANAIKSLGMFYSAYVIGSEEHKAAIERLGEKAGVKAPAPQPKVVQPHPVLDDGPGMDEDDEEMPPAPPPVPAAPSKPEPTPGGAEEVDLSAMTNAELVEYAGLTFGKEIKGNKLQLMEQIRALAKGE